MTPKHKAILAQLPVGMRAAAQAYYDELAKYEAKFSEFKRAQVDIKNAGRQLSKASNAVQGPGHRQKGKLYIALQTGQYYEGIESVYFVQPIKADGYPGKRKQVWPRGPLVELPPDHPFREKRKVALLCKKLEGEG